MKPFGEEHAANYDASFAKLSPWAESLRLVTRLALTSLPTEGHVLCVGAGTGAELLYLAEAFPGCRFTALDPSGAMLNRCRARAIDAGIESRCMFHEGYADTLEPKARFDGATALLVSQFVVQREHRVAFFQGIRELVAAGAPLVTADLSHGPKHEARLWALMGEAWRYAGTPDERVSKLVRRDFGGLLSVIGTDAYEAMLQEAGWSEPTLAFQAAMMHGWLTWA